MRPQREERSPPHSADTTRPIPITDAPPSEDLTSSNLSNPSGESPNNSVTQPHPLPTPRASHVNNPLALHLQVKPIPNRFQMPKVAIFEPASDSMGHAVNRDIHVDLHTAFEELICRAFLATLDKSLTGAKRTTTGLHDLIQPKGSEGPLPSHRGIRNHELTRELGLRPPCSIYELNEIIARHISIEKTEKWWVEQDRLLIDWLDHKKASRVPTNMSARPKPMILTTLVHRDAHLCETPYDHQVTPGDPAIRPNHKATPGDPAIRRPPRTQLSMTPRDLAIRQSPGTQPLGDPWGPSCPGTPRNPAIR
ncbi:hypothetical protein ACLOJK_010812 [Asimina triloba]